MKPDALFSWIKVIFTLALLALVGWLAYQIFKKGKDTVAAVKEGSAYLFGTSNTSTIGTDLQTFVEKLFAPAPRADGKPAYWDDAQAAKTQAILDARKSGMSSTLSKAGSYTFITPGVFDTLGVDSISGYGGTIYRPN